MEHKQSQRKMIARELQKCEKKCKTIGITMVFLFFVGLPTYVIVNDLIMKLIPQYMLVLQLLITSPLVVYPAYVLMKKYNKERHNIKTNIYKILSTFKGADLTDFPLVRVSIKLGEEYSAAKCLEQSLPDYISKKSIRSVLIENKNYLIFKLLNF